ncbi:hypothetical protein EUGRSUZ_H03104 [Eucalyptus grandis]|uniref:Uncharacterized protein n=2 Tax=Eucalyptus grandis TaxID=71139 RepID=A0ACC3JUG9_EUCGR|nr:hypothetical protein EUGRSUZ_H03104 [Eucalyptus grandis]
MIYLLRALCAIRPLRASPSPNPIVLPRLPHSSLVRRSCLCSHSSLSLSFVLSRVTSLCEILLGEVDSFALEQSACLRMLSKRR